MRIDEMVNARIRRSIGVPEMDRYLREESNMDEDDESKKTILQSSIANIKHHTPLLICHQLVKIQRLINEKMWLVHHIITTDVFKGDRKEICLPTTSSRSGLLGDIVLLRGTIRRSVDCSFDRIFDLLPSGLRILEQREEFVLLANCQRFLAMLMLHVLRSFQSFYSFLRLSVHASPKLQTPET
ncbi:hypothetical protein H5410_020895 [Solanum commersonii]|uniref:Uncharacterized protein n=1 Tax=Solanum commersonii TaxID=4109 RepID=A0A9J5ZFK7_SOLCO|nr:hypothetical protein H5410_020895 [Solanum commersonii]